MKTLLAGYDDDGLQDLMTNLAGHDMEAVLEALREVDSDVPHCFIAYTIKGFGLPFAGHKDNHAGIMTEDQMADFRAAMDVDEGAEWARFSGLGLDDKTLKEFIAAAPFNRKPGRHSAPSVPLPDALPLRPGPRMSTQEAFGRILNELGKGESPLAERIVTTSPDVTVSTNLGGWVNQRGIFDRADREDVFRSEKVVSMQKWSLSRNGQHIELGIAENNLFLLLAALGLSDGYFGTRLLPVGTVYDPFIARGLDALNYACYQDARFLLAGTPSGITLAPEGGAHQSVGTPLLGMGQPGLTSFEPAFADELAEIMLWGFGHLQEPDGGAVYCRLSTRTIDQPAREIDAALRHDLLAGGYWLVEPAPESPLALVFSGAVAPEVRAAHEELAEEIPGIGLLAVTSADRLYGDLLAAAEARTHGEAVAATHGRGAAGPPAAGCRARHRAGRPPGVALLARHGHGPPRLSAGSHRLRRIRRHSGALRQAPDRHRRHPRHGRVGLRRPRPPPRLICILKARLAVSAEHNSSAKTYLTAVSGRSAPCRLRRGCAVATGLRQFVACLHPHPVLGGAPADVFQRQRHARRYAGPAVQQARQRAALALQTAGGLGNVPADLLHAFADQLAQARRVEHSPHPTAIVVAHQPVLLPIAIIPDVPLPKLAPGCRHITSWPGLSRPSTCCSHNKAKERGCPEQVRA